MNNIENKEETLSTTPREMFGNGFSAPSEELDIEKFLKDFEIV